MRCEIIRELMIVSTAADLTISKNSSNSETIFNSTKNAYNNL